MTHHRLSLAGLAAATCLALVGCGTPASTPAATQPSQGASAPAPTEAKELTVVTHSSFSVPDEALEKFKSETGYSVKISKLADAGTMTNQLVLTKSNPMGDVVFGIDNTFAGRAIKEGILAPYASPALPADADDLKADGQDLFTPIDFGDVCVNADKKWFDEKGLAVPRTMDDLANPNYKDLLVVEHAASSSTGLAFLTATVGAKGEDGYLEFWDRLKTNGVKVVKDWEAAYYTEFSGSSGKGPRPLVVSYASSPAAEVPKGGGEPPTVSLPRTCFRQVEYAGVLAGAKNEVGARKFVDFLLSDEVQAGIPEAMYMYPAVKSTKLPSAWAKYAPLTDLPFTVPAEKIAANRETWIAEWSAKVIG